MPSGLKQPSVAQAGQVRELALLEHRLRQAVVHAVEPEDDHSLEPASPERPPAEQGPLQQPHRPGDEGQQGRPDRGEDGEERPGQGKAGAGPDVGMGLARQQQNQGDGQEQQSAKLLRTEAHFFSLGSFAFSELLAPSLPPWHPALQRSFPASSPCRRDRHNPEP